MSSDCVETSYTTPIGLQFTLYCNAEQTDKTDLGDIDRVKLDTVEECMRRCSTNRGKACGAVSFDKTTRTCYIKNMSITSDGIQTGKALNSMIAIANRSQYEPLSSDCSSDKETQTAKNGLKFQTYCNQSFAKRDLCTDAEPACRAHTKTFGACLDHCSTLRPLCTGVAWDPTLKFGYANCYPKTGSAVELDGSRERVEARVAGKAMFEISKDDCRLSANGTISASNQETFRLSCDEDRIGTNLSAQHVASLDKCIDFCTTYPGNGTACLGAVFDSTMTDGYENCYLKSTVGGSRLGQIGVTFASRQVPDKKELSPPPASKAWIAGPAVGGVLAIAVIFAVWWWWRRKMQGMREMDGYGAHELIANNESVSSDRSELVASTPSPKYELGGVDHARPVYEMDLTVKR